MDKELLDQINRNLTDTSTGHSLTLLVVIESLIERGVLDRQELIVQLREVARRRAPTDPTGVQQLPLHATMALLAASGQPDKQTKN